MTGCAPDEEEQSSRVGSSLPQPREAVAQRVWRGQASHKWHVTKSRMGRRAQIGPSVGSVSHRA